MEIPHTVDSLVLRDARRERNREGEEKEKGKRERKREERVGGMARIMAPRHVAGNTGRENNAGLVCYVSDSDSSGWGQGGRWENGEGRWKVVNFSSA